MNYLAQIIVYWKARKEAEKDAHSHNNFLTNPAIESENALIKTGVNTEDGCVHRKEERLADTRIWSYCLYEQCRDVVVSFSFSLIKKDDMLTLPIEIWYSLLQTSQARHLFTKDIYTNR